MTDRQTRAILLRLAGHTYSEIAEEMGIAPQRAYQLVDRARKSGRYRAIVTVRQVDGADAQEFADALREYLVHVGFTKPEES